MKKTVRDIEVGGKRVLLRVDLNVPLNEGVVSDNTQIIKALETIRFLLAAGARIVVCSHLGHPQGRSVAELKMNVVANQMSHLLGKNVHKVDTCIGPEVAATIEGLAPGDIVLLENTQFFPGEINNDPTFAAELAQLGDVFVNDDFAYAHTSYASNVGVARLLPGVIGLLMEQELKALSKVMANPRPPLVAIMGGGNVTEKIGMIERTWSRCQQIMIGGILGNTLLKLTGHNVQASTIDESCNPQLAELLEQYGHKLILPTDVMALGPESPSGRHRFFSVGELPDGWRILDIGPSTMDRFKQCLGKAQTVIWNGPLGDYSTTPFHEGTFEIAKYLAELPITVIVGGHHTAQAMHQVGVADKLTYVSTGRGAFVAFIEGRELPALAALQDRITASDHNL